MIELHHLRRPRPDIPVSELGTLPTLAEIERDYLERVLKYTRGDKWAAARILGVSLRTIQRRLQRAEFTDLHEGEAA